MTDWNVHNKSRMCEYVEVTAIDLEGEFLHKVDVFRIPDKYKMLAEILFWMPRVTDKMLDIFC